MKLLRSLAVTASLMGGAVLLGHAASVPTLRGPLDPGNTLNTFNQVIQSINANVPGYSGVTGVNYLDNGAMAVTQRGTADTTGGNTSGCNAPVTQYPADRWCVDTNVTSGVGHGQIVTSSPAPPTGFANSLKMWRTSGALLQPVCLIQEIPTSRTVQLRGKQVIFSAYVQPLAALTSTGGAISATLLTGTGTDEGLGTMTASPAITPAWTGIASTTLTTGEGLTINGSPITAGTSTYALGLTAAWNRVWSRPATVPVTATEAGVAVCFTPASASSGATDGFAISGALLEAAGANQVTPSAYPFLPYSQELAMAQRYFYKISEVADGVFGNGMISATNVQTVAIPLPVTMRAAPALTLTAGGFKFNIAGTLTAVGAGFAAGTVQTPGVINVVGAVTATVAQGTQLVGSATTGSIIASADF